MTPGSSFITRCKLCPHRFEAPSFEIPLVGQQIPERVSKYVQALANHLQKKHPPQTAGAAMAMQHMFGIECLKNFEVEDPSLLGMLDGVRRALHLATRSVFITDPMLQEAVARLELSEADAARVLTAMQELRDVLTEAKPQPVSALVQPNGR